jgi:chorismate mutase
MKPPLFILILVITGVRVFAQIPVTDAASILQQELSTAETLAQWAQSIAQLKIQVSQSNQQIAIQGDLRSWTGNPSVVSVNVSLSTLGAGSLTQSYGQSQATIVNVPNSVASLDNTSSGTYRALQDTDLSGNPVQHDSLTYRRYSVMDAQQQNYQQVVTSTNTRQQQLQQDLASTLIALKDASTEAEVQKQSAKVNALNGQLAALGATRRDQADQVAAQKAANDSRQEEERHAAAELEAQDDYLASQRITAYMQTLTLRQNSNENP